MKELLLQILIVCYAFVGVMVVVGYWPTIRDLYHHKKKGANIKSYVIWTLTSAISFLYALFILSDLLLRIVVGLNFASCALVLLLSINLRNKG
jgi:hypothetical protein